MYRLPASEEEVTFARIEALLAATRAQSVINHFAGDLVCPFVSHKLNGNSRQWQPGHATEFR